MDVDKSNGSGKNGRKNDKKGRPRKVWSAKRKAKFAENEVVCRALGEKHLGGAGELIKPAFGSLDKAVPGLVMLPESEAREIKRRGPRVAFSPELGEYVCELISQGYSLRQIARLDDSGEYTMPDIRTLLRWLSDTTHNGMYDKFRESYRLAREIAAEYYAQEIIEISDNTDGDYMILDNGLEVPNKEHILRSRLRVDARRWVAAKLLPKKYGDKQEVEHTGGLTIRREIVGGESG